MCRASSVAKHCRIRTWFPSLNESHGSRFDRSFRFKLPLTVATHASLSVATRSKPCINIAPPACIGSSDCTWFAKYLHGKAKYLHNKAKYLYNTACCQLISCIDPHPIFAKYLLIWKAGAVWKQMIGPPLEGRNMCLRQCLNEKLNTICKLWFFWGVCWVRPRAMLGPLLLLLLVHWV